MEKSVTLEKSKKFAIRIVNLYNYLKEKKQEKTMSMQILRSGTSIGANVAEAIYAASKADFINKLQIAMKESRETQYWLEILFETNFINEEEFESLKQDCVELIKLLIATLNSSKKS